MPTRMYSITADGNYQVGTPFGIVTVYLDEIPGGSASHHIIQGWGLTRLAVVAGFQFDPDAPPTMPALIVAAINAIVEITGDRGSPCPDIDVGTYLEQFLPDQVSLDVVKIRIVYKGYPIPSYELAGCLSQVESNLDLDGNLITVEYTYPTTYMLDPRKAGLTIKQGGMITRPVSEPIFILKFIITAGTIGGLAASALDIATYYKVTYEGHVNQNTYIIGRMVAQPTQLLIDSIHATSKDGGFSFESTWTFHLRPSGWDPLVVFINPDDGKPPPDLEPNTGFKNVKSPPRAQFPIFFFGPN